MTVATKMGVTILLLIVLFCGWYTVAANYSYKAVSGTYSFRFNGDKSTLVLNRVVASSRSCDTVKVRCTLKAVGGE